MTLFSSPKSLVKSIPGLVCIVRSSRKLLIQTINKFLSYFWWLMLKTPKNRRCLYTSLPDGYGYIACNSKDESYVVDSRDNMIGRALFAKGQFDFHKFIKAFGIVELFAPNARAFHLIDIGANIGSICIPAVKRRYVKKCIAFELDPDNYRLLTINCILNKVEHLVSCNNYALGDKQASITVKKSRSNFGDHRVDDTALNDKEQLIPMITLDSILNEIDLKSTILWMDVQGYEWHVLKGASTFLSACVPLILEFSPSELHSFDALDKLITLLSDSEYNTYWDLSFDDPQPSKLAASSLHALSSRLAQNSDFTDLLILRIQNN